MILLVASDGHPVSAEDAVIDEDTPFEAEERSKVSTVAPSALEKKKTKQKGQPKDSKSKELRANSNLNDTPDKSRNPMVSVATARATRSRTNQKLSVPGEEKSAPSEPVIGSSPLSVREDTGIFGVPDPENETAEEAQREDRQGSGDWLFLPKTKSPITCEQPQANRRPSLTEHFRISSRS